MTRAEAIQFARHDLYEGVLPISVTEELQERGFSSLEAEEIVDQAMFDLENEHE